MLSSNKVDDDDETLLIKNYEESLQFIINSRSKNTLGKKESETRKQSHKEPELTHTSTIFRFNPNQPQQPQQTKKSVSKPILVPPTIDTVGPPPEHLSTSSDSTEASMLMAWYMAGYHTGYHQALKHHKFK